ncbi:MAG TPA: response regulator [Gammaproteobacteria bacterium]|nr:response regulator [Gammaproteobacteria bacterium]
MRETETGQRVLIIEDEAQIRKFLRISLEAHGYTVAEARTGDQGIELAGREPPDLVVLDLGLPDMEGVKVIRRLREWSAVPIIVLSVRAEEREKVQCLDAGADDYMTKPFGIAELMARLRALLRNRRREAGSGTAVIRSGGLVVDLNRRLVTLAGETVQLSRKEYDLLRLLATHAGQVLTHQQILQEIWGESHTEDTHYLRVLVGNLRQKLRDEPTRPRHILTEQGVGYRFVDDRGL